MRMQSQDPEHLISTEDIYNKMTRDTFRDQDSFGSDNSEFLTGNNFSLQDKSHLNIQASFINDRIIHTLTVQLQDLLPGAFRIIPQPKQCLSYANLQDWSPGRSYFSVFEMKRTKSVWILHLSRSAGEGLASLSHKKYSRIYSNIYNDLNEADSVIFLETAEMLRKLFNSLLKIWPTNYKLKVDRCRHILHLAFLNGYLKDEPYTVLPFYLRNQFCNGQIQLVLPQKYLNNFSN